MRIVIGFLVSLLMCQSINAQKPYKLNLAIDIPVTALGIAGTAWGFSKLSKKESTDSMTIMALDKNDLARINRSAAGNFDEQAKKVSDYLFYGSFPLPVIFMLDRTIRQDAGTYSLLYLQALGWNGTLYSNLAAHKDKFRPLVYGGDEVPMSEKMRGNAKNSFPGGHPSVTAVSMFFMAKTWGDYHPDSKLTPYLYGIAGISSVTNAYLRYKAGKHFPTDLFVGVSMGTLLGIFVPHLHKVSQDSKIDLGGFNGPGYSGLSISVKL